MKKLKFVLRLQLFIFFGIATGFAQQNTVAAGGEATGSTGTLSYSVGQIDYFEATGSGGTANYGVQQPYEFFVLGEDDFKTIELIATVFPNPTAEQVTLQISEMQFDTLRLHLFDLSGRDIYQSKITSEETIIPMYQLASATYFLSVFDQNSLLKTFKIIKK